MSNRLLELTATITAAYLENNRANPDELPQLIRSVHQSLKTAEEPQAEPGDQVERPTPAQIRKSITRDAIISFEDGRPYKSMKRSLARLGMTPADYREKWGLPHDYPMVAPSYSAQRSALAKQLGLGQKGAAARSPVKAKRGRAKAQG